MRFVVFEKIKRDSALSPAVPKNETTTLQGTPIDHTENVVLDDVPRNQSVVCLIFKDCRRTKAFRNLRDSSYDDKLGDVGDVMTYCSERFV